MKYIPLFFIALLLTACGDKPKPQFNEDIDVADEENTETEAMPPAIAVMDADNDSLGVFGYYVGEFIAVEYDDGKAPSYSNKITISLDSTVGGVLYGHSVVAGNKRPFYGDYTLNESGLTASVDEPGDDKYDGSFQLTVMPGEKKMEGTWVANDKNLAVTKRKYTLESRTFSYVPSLELPELVSWSELYSPVADDFEYESTTDDVLRFNASTQRLAKEDVQNLYQGDLEIIRNAIYARHGYSFKNRKMRYVFDSAVDWYMPVSTDVTDQLTPIELENIELIKRYEDHADKYYDSFGR